MTPARAFLSRKGTVKVLRIVVSSDRYVGNRAWLGTPTKFSRSSTNEKGNPERISSAGITTIPYGAFNSPYARKRCGTSKGKVAYTFGLTTTAGKSLRILSEVFRLPFALDQT